MLCVCGCNRCRCYVVIEQQVLYGQLGCTATDNRTSDQSEQAITSIMSSPFFLSVSGLPLAKASCTFSPARRIWFAVSASRACLAEACLPACLMRRCTLLRDIAEKLSDRWQAHGRRLQTGKLEGLRTVSDICISSVLRSAPSFGKGTSDNKREC